MQKILSIAEQLAALSTPESTAQASELIQKLESELQQFEAEVEQHVLLKKATGAQVEEILPDNTSAIEAPPPRPTLLATRNSWISLNIKGLRVSLPHSAPPPPTNPNNVSPSPPPPPPQQQIRTQASGKNKGLFRPYLIHPHLEVVDPRDTFAKRLFGEKASVTIFKLYRNLYFSGLLATMFIIGEYAAAVSMPGYRPDDGYLAVLAIPPSIFFGLLYNVYLTKRVLREFETWSLITLFGLIIGSLFDMLRDQPARQIGIVGTFPLLMIVFADARPFHKGTKYNFVHGIFLIGTLGPFYIALTYYIGQFYNFYQTSIEVTENISVSQSHRNCDWYSVLV
jgi:hypothetical protein